MSVSTPTNDRKRYSLRMHGSEVYETMFCELYCLPASGVFRLAVAAIQK